MIEDRQLIVSSTAAKNYQTDANTYIKISELEFIVVMWKEMKEKAKRPKLYQTVEHWNLRLQMLGSFAETGTLKKDPEVSEVSWL